MSLSDLEDKENKYEKCYKYEEIRKEFSVLPETVKNELVDLMNFQVFIAGLAKNKKVEINKSGDSLLVEFQNIAKAPVGAEYSVSILLEKSLI